jgi:hypothetical protein
VVAKTKVRSFTARLKFLGCDRLCGLVAEFLATDPEVPGFIPDAARSSGK